MQPVSIPLLGRCALGSQTSDGNVAVTSGTAVLLARLALSPCQSLDPKRLAELLWPDRGGVQALAKSSPDAVDASQGRCQPRPPPIFADRHSVRMDPRIVEVDAVVFGRRVRSGTRTDLERGAEIYGGD